MIKKITTAALLIFFLNVHVSAKIFQFNLYGEMDVKWNEFENSFDKTATKKDSNGQDYFDDRNGFVRGAFKIGLKMWMSKWAFANVEVMKNDTLWASHNRQFIAEKYAMLGQVFGSADTVGTDVWTGMKIGKGYFTVRNLFYNTLSLRVGRQFLSFSQYPDSPDHDLVVCATLDAMKADLDLPRLSVMAFAAKAVEDTAHMYLKPVAWNIYNQYGSPTDTATAPKDEDMNIWGVNVKLYRFSEILGGKIFFVQGTQHDDTITVPWDSKTEESIYCRRNFIGSSLRALYNIRKRIKVKGTAQFVYEFGKRYMTDYKYLYTDPSDSATYATTTSASWNDEVAISSWLLNVKGTMDIPLIKKKTKLSIKGQLITGSRDNPNQPGEDNGFSGFNDKFIGSFASFERDGWGLITKANPYKPLEYFPHAVNSLTGYKVDSYGSRTFDPTFMLYPAQIIHAGLEYELTQTRFKGLSLAADFFNYVNLKEYGIAYSYTGPDGNVHKGFTKSLGNELDLQLKFHTPDNNLQLSLAYCLYFPGDAYKIGVDPTLNVMRGGDTVKLFQVRTKLMFF